jgi:hypothetical protein
VRGGDDEPTLHAILVHEYLDVPGVPHLAHLFFEVRLDIGSRMLLLRSRCRFTSARRPSRWSAFDRCAPRRVCNTSVVRPDPRTGRTAGRSHSQAAGSRIVQASGGQRRPSTNRDSVR